MSNNGVKTTVDSPWGFTLVGYYPLHWHQSSMLHEVLCANSKLGLAQDATLTHWDGP